MRNSLTSISLEDIVVEPTGTIRIEVGQNGTPVDSADAPEASIGEMETASQDAAEGADVVEQGQEDVQALEALAIDLQGRIERGEVMTPINARAFNARIKQVTRKYPTPTKRLPSTESYADSNASAIASMQVTLEHIRISQEGIGENVMNGLKKVWEAFKAFLAGLFDTNVRMKNRLEAIKKQIPNMGNEGNKAIKDRDIAKTFYTKGQAPNSESVATGIENMASFLSAANDNRMMQLWVTILSVNKIVVGGKDILGKGPREAQEYLMKLVLQVDTVFDMFKSSLEGAVQKNDLYFNKVPVVGNVYPFVKYNEHVRDIKKVDTYEDFIKFFKTIGGLGYGLRRLDSKTMDDATYEKGLTSLDKTGVSKVCDSVGKLLDVTTKLKSNPYTQKDIGKEFANAYKSVSVMADPKIREGLTTYIVVTQRMWMGLATSEMQAVGQAVKVGLAACAYCEKSIKVSTGEVEPTSNDTGEAVNKPKSGGSPTGRADDVVVE